MPGQRQLDGCGVHRTKFHLVWVKAARGDYMIVQRLKPIDEDALVKEHLDVIALSSAVRDVYVGIRKPKRCEFINDRPHCVGIAIIYIKADEFTAISVCKDADCVFLLQMIS